MAKTDILYDRTIMIHTSQIPYAEFRRICKKDLDTYIEYNETSPIPLTKIIRMELNILIPPSWKINLPEGVFCQSALL